VFFSFMLVGGRGGGTNAAQPDRPGGLADWGRKPDFELQ